MFRYIQGETIRSRDLLEKLIVTQIVRCSPLMAPEGSLSYSGQTLHPDSYVCPLFRLSDQNFAYAFCMPDQSHPPLCLFHDNRIRRGVPAKLSLWGPKGPPSVPWPRAGRRHNPEDVQLRFHLREKLRSQYLFSL